MKGKFLSSVISFTEQLIITLFIMSMIFTYVFRIVDVDGESMMNTLNDGDRVIVFALKNDVKQGDIAVIRTDTAVTLDENGMPVRSDGFGMTVIKRVIACEGQTVDIDFAAGAVYVDGERLYEEYIELGLTHDDEGAFTGQYPVTVPEGCLFVMGDNRSVSLDSRSPIVGFVPEECVTGRALLKIYPTFGVLE